MLRDDIISWLEIAPYLRNHRKGWVLLRDTETLSTRRLFSLEKENTYNRTVLAIRLEEALNEMPDPADTPAEIRTEGRQTPDSVKELYVKWSELRVQRGVAHSKLYTAANDDERYEVAKEVMRIGKEISQTWHYIKTWKQYGIMPEDLQREEDNNRRIRNLSSNTAKVRKQLAKELKKEKPSLERVEYLKQSIADKEAEKKALEDARIKYTEA